MTQTSSWRNPEEAVITQRRPQQIVEQHVLCNVTGLINMLVEYDDEDARELMYGHGEDDEGALEVWAVTKWLADKLIARDHRVHQIWGQYYWARCATGQAIRMDSVIEEIASCR